MILDHNPTAKLVLMCDDAYHNCRYEPWHEESPTIHDAPLTYVKQAHYVCRAKIQGLTVSRVEPILPGWQRWEELKQWERRHIV